MKPREFVTKQAIGLGGMAEWRVVPAEPMYWHPINKGFNSKSAKFMCSGWSRVPS